MFAFRSTFIVSICTVCSTVQIVQIACIFWGQRVKMDDCGRDKKKRSQRANSNKMWQMRAHLASALAHTQTHSSGTAKYYYNPYFSWHLKLVKANDIFLFSIARHATTNRPTDRPTDEKIQMYNKCNSGARSSPWRCKSVICTWCVRCTNAVKLVQISLECLLSKAEAN